MPTKIVKRLLFVLAVLALIVLALSFVYTRSSYAGTTYTHTQSSWSGGATTTSTTHTDDQSGWTYYESTSNIVGTTTNIKLASATTTITETSDTDFDGTFLNTQVSGSGSGASVVSVATTSAAWSAMADAPAALGAGASLAYPGSGDYIYVLAGGVGTTFYRYSISGNSWSTMTAIPASVSSGGDIISTGNDYLYAHRGSSAKDFYRYSISGNSWSNMASTTVSFAAGASLVYPVSGDYMYATAGGGGSNTTFYRYSISSNSWSATTSAPGTSGFTSGASLAYSGSGDYIYTFTGWVANFYRYAISGDSWTIMTNAPGTIYDGGSLVYPDSGNYMYAFRGNNTTTFYRYSISGNSWSTLTAAPEIIKNGSSLVYPDSGNYIYTPRGGGYLTFYRYSLSNSSNTWGTYTSGGIDLGASATLSSFSYATTTLANTWTSLSVRAGNTASPDATWSNWEHRVANGGDISSHGPARYVQYKATLTSDGVSQPSLDSATVSYSGYETLGTLISAPYNTESTASLVTSLSWTEDATLPAGSYAQLSLRSAATSGGLTGATWYDFTSTSTGCTKVTSTVTCSTIPTALADESNDQYLQYKVTLTGDGTGTPTLDDIAVAYIQDQNAPAVIGVTATPGATTATVTWTSDELTSSRIGFGVTATYSSTTPEFDISPRVTAHSVLLSPLVSCTTYHYQAGSTDASSNTASSTDATFTTTGCTGSATVESEIDATITTASGGTATVGDLTITAPSGFSASDATFQLKALDDSRALATAGTPTGYTAVLDTIYDLSALTDEATALSSFDIAITVSLSYTPGDVSGLSPSSLRLFRNDGTSWTALDACSVSASAVTCTTSAFSIIGLFGTPAGGGTSFRYRLLAQEEEDVIDAAGDIDLIVATFSELLAAAEGDGPTPADEIVGAMEALVADLEALVGSGEQGATDDDLFTDLLALFSISTETVETFLMALLSPETPTQTPETATTTPQIPAAQEAAHTYTFTRDLRYRDTGEDVRELQKLLNRLGFTLADDGPGSSENETTYFGPLTKSAVTRLQEAHRESILTPLNLSQGSGYFGPATRAFLNGFVRD